jgi:hypothetical protein
VTGGERDGVREALLMKARLCHSLGMARASGFGLASGLMVRTAALWVCGLSLATWSAAALPAQDDRTPTLHVYANLVQIPTLVVDRDQGPVAPIAEGRFFVSVDGGPKFRVTHVRPEGDDPISLAIVLDVSQAFPNLTMGIDDAIAGLAPLSLHAKDHVSVYSMDCKLVRSVNGAPADSVTLKQAVDVALQPWKTHGRERWTSECKEPTNLWDSLAAVSRALSQQPGRRVILVVTDGLDRGSKTTWNELRELAQERGVAIFGLSQTGDSMFRVGSRTFNSLCEMSGGIVLTASEKDIAEQLKRFAALVRGRYIVEFPHPVDTMGGEHGMEITIEKSDAIALPTGIGIPVDDPAILKDPTTVPLDPSSVPQMGKKKVISPN